jgi:hypothetical protein
LKGCVATADPAACNDSNPCTDDSCDAGIGCVHVANDKNACNDADKCNGYETCQAGVCVPGEIPVCDDGNPCTDGKCDPVLGCQYTPNDKLTCADGNECNGVESCQGGKCVPGTPMSCDDGNPCSIDACTPGKGCSHAPAADLTPCPGGPSYACLAGKCICIPDCSGIACGDNGCGGFCACPQGQTCFAGTCYEDACAGACTGHTAEAYLCALDICQTGLVQSFGFSSPTGDTITSAWDAVAHFGSPTNDLAPKAGTSYGLLATGPATGTAHSTDLPGGGAAADPFSKDGYQTYDNVEFKLTLTAPAGVTGFSVSFVFFSEEYYEYSGSSYNDKFYMLLTGPQTTGGQKKVINWTACTDPGKYYDFQDKQGQKWCYIAVNTAYSEPCPTPDTDISGTGFECGTPDAQHGSSTGWLKTSWPILPGETFDLVFHIHDTSDGIYDSEVILDAFQWLTGPFSAGTVKL